eukprot:9157301-Alexandrium_andersonii.AAC.1
MQHAARARQKARTRSREGFCTAAEQRTGHSRQRSAHSASHGADRTQPTACEAARDSTLGGSQEGVNKR